jgi:hypothetical protein
MTHTCGYVGLVRSLGLTKSSGVEWVRERVCFSEFVFASLGLTQSYSSSDQTPTIELNYMTLTNSLISFELKSCHRTKLHVTYLSLKMLPVALQQLEDCRALFRSFRVSPRPPTLIHIYIINIMCVYIRIINTFIHIYVICVCVCVYIYHECIRNGWNLAHWYFRKLKRSRDLGKYCRIHLSICLCV